tara:strand:- start:399 stop:677 length:279 start_codon:yes stop_codon:yes gene_type:complete
MTSLDKDFTQATEDIKKIIKKLDNEDILYLYGLYKQAILGKNTNPRPSIFNFIGRQKWKAWTDVSEFPKDQAKIRYINLVKNLSDETPQHQT